MRISFDQALALNLITKEEAKAAKHVRTRSRDQKKHASRGKKKLTPEALKTGAWCPIEGTTPQERLWRAICFRWPQQAVWEMEALVPQRKYKVDIYFPAARLAIEVDGFQYHGKFLNDFKKDRIRQNLFVIYGYRVLRFFAYEIHNEMESILTIISLALTAGGEEGRESVPCYEFMNGH